jgi:hypothetical protein
MPKTVLWSIFVTLVLISPENTRYTIFALVPIHTVLPVSVSHVVFFNLQRKIGYAKWLSLKDLLWIYCKLHLECLDICPYE